MRRFVWIIVLVIAILALGWSGGWYALASWVEGRIPAVLDEIGDRGVELECARQGVVGFPFAVQVACGEIGVAERSTGSEAEFGGVTGGVTVFAPFTAAVAFQSPAEIRSPLLPGGAQFQWEEAELGIGLGVSGPQNVSFEAVNLSAELLGANVGASAASGTLAPADDGGTDATLSFAGLVLADSETTLPPLDGNISGWISVPPRALAAGRAGLQAPFSARLFETTLVTGGSRIEAEGNVTVDAEGIIDGTVTVRLAGAGGFQAFIAALPPEYQERGNQAIGGLFLFGSPITLDGAPASELVVEIVRGKVAVGPVEVTLPRLPL